MLRNRLLREYTIRSSQLNRELIRGRPLSGRQLEIHRSVMDAAVPCAKDMVLFSGTHDNDLSKCVRNGVLVSPAHLSATPSRVIASEFAFATGGRSQMLKVLVKAGTPVVWMSPMSEHPDEEEVILPSGTTLRLEGTNPGFLEGGFYEGKKATIHDFVTV